MHVPQREFLVPLESPTPIFLFLICNGILTFICTIVYLYLYFRIWSEIAMLIIIIPTFQCFICNRYHQLLTISVSRILIFGILYFSNCILTRESLVGMAMRNVCTICRFMRIDAQMRICGCAAEDKI